MARRDVINFSSLKKAIEQRYRFRNDPNNINYKIFRSIPFEPQTDPHSIFGWIYTTFRELIRTKHLILNQYLNIEDKSVLEKLFKNLERDPNLRFLNIPDAALNDSGYELSDQYYLKQSKEIAEAQQAEQMASAAAPSGSSTGGMPGMPSFSAPSIAVRPQMVHNIPRAEAESQKLFVANSSGAVTGEKEITPTGVHSAPQGPSEIVLTDRNDKEIGKLSANQTPKTSTSELHIDKSGNITETHTPGRSAPAPTPQPKLIVTDRHGNPAPQPLKRPETAKLFTQDKNNIIREHTVKSPSRFSGFKSSLKNIDSKAGVFFQRNVGKHLTGDRAMGLLEKAGNTGINALSGITNLGGRPGGVFSHIGGFNKNGGGRGFFGRFGKGRGQGGSLAGKAKGKGGLIFAAGLIGSMVLVGGMAAFAPNPTPGEAAPLPTNNFGLDYTLPLKSTSVQPADIKAQVKAAFPGAKLEYWDKIVQSSLAAGFNPALALALWIEETGASHTTLARNGGSEIPVNGSFTKGHLGCAPTEDQTIDESLTCLFKFVAKYNFADGQFADFMAKYSGGPTNDPFSNNPNFTKNIKAWYSQLVPTGIGAIAPIAPPSNTPVTAIASCPVQNGRISTPSYYANPNTGHCGGNYGYNCKCSTTGRRAKAIDVPTNGKNVYLPTINNQSVTWRIVVGPYSVDSQEGGGFGYTFQAEQGNDTWYLDMLHLNRSALAIGSEAVSGTPVATANSHAHMTIGKNLKQVPVAGTATDCDSNWLPSDFLCQ